MEINYNYQLPETQYIKEITTKNQIVLHHTCSGDGIDGDVTWWKKTPERVAAQYIISRDGRVYELFSDNYWAYHLGIKKSVFTEKGLSWQNLDKQSIGIELDSWGPLLPFNHKFYPVKWEQATSRYLPNTSCKPVSTVCEYCSSGKFRGFQYFEAYTMQQLVSLKELLILLLEKHHIDYHYDKTMWDVSTNALRGRQGIYAHASYRADKSDIHPQMLGWGNIVKMLKEL